MYQISLYLKTAKNVAAGSHYWQNTWKYYIKMLLLKKIRVTLHYEVRNTFKKYGIRTSFWYLYDGL